MGIWGPGIYQDDLAADIRDYYKDQLRRGKQGEEITNDLLTQYQITLSDSDEAPVFWFSLADTQWDLGRLEDKVKNAALKHICAGDNLSRWKEENPKTAIAREQVIERLHQKLLSPQPPKKKISQYRIYTCEWNVGDVFAYQLQSDIAKEKGLYGRYFLIQKIDETIWHPGHTVPIIYTKITNDTKVPLNVEEYDSQEYIQTGSVHYKDRFFPIDMSRPQEDIAEKSKIKYQVDEYGFLPEYRAVLLNTSKKIITTNLIYVGNFSSATRPEIEFVPHSKHNIIPVSWKQGTETFETKMIKLYEGYNCRKFVFYDRKDG